MKKPALSTLAKVLTAALGILLIGWLLYGSAWVREFVVSHAGALGPFAVPYLCDVVAHDKDHHVRQSAAAALLAIGADAVPPLVASLADNDDEVRKDAALALLLLGAKAKEALPNLIEALKNDTEMKVRKRAAKTLGLMEAAGKEAVPALLAAVKEPEAAVRAEAAEALGRIGRAVEVEGVIPALIEALTDPDTDVRQEAAEGLGRIGPRAKAAVPALTKALDDADRGVQGEAKDALRQVQRGRPELDQIKD